MKEVNYGPTAQEIAQNDTETPAFELPKNNVVTYTVTGNDVCPRGIFAGVITDAFSEPHPTEKFSVAVVLVDAETQAGVQKLRIKIPLKTGHRMHRLRLHSGESVESLRAELLNGTNGTANTTHFDLNKLHGRALFVQVRDDEFNNVKFTRVDSVDPDLRSVAREAVLVNKAPPASKQKNLSGHTERKTPVSECFGTLSTRTFKTHF